MAAVVLIRALKAIRHGGGLPLTFIRLCGAALAQARQSPPLHMALKIAFTLFFTGNGEALCVLLQLQMERLSDRMYIETTLGSVQPA